MPDMVRALPELSLGLYVSGIREEGLQELLLDQKASLKFLELDFSNLTVFFAHLTGRPPTSE